jgi:hypothetical protein
MSKKSKRTRRRDRATERAPGAAPGASATGDEPRSGARGGFRIGTGLAALLFAGLSLVYYLPALLPGGHLFGSDYFAASYFYMEWLSGEFARGAIPKWLPYVYGGVPWFANAGATWYPPRLLGDLFLPAYKLFAFMYFVQGAAAGLGAFLLFRELRCRPWVAFVAALSYQFTGVLMSFVYAGHDGRMIVASFAPMAFFFLHRAIRTGGVGAFAGVAATYGMCMLSNQIQSTYYLLLAGALWAVFVLWQHGYFRRAKPLLRRVVLGVVAIALAFGLAAVNFLPFLGYVDASPRAGEGRGYEYATSWSMAPGEIVALAVPEQSGILQDYRNDVEGANPFKYHTEYVGAFALALLLLGAFFSRRDRRWWFFAGLGAFMLTISLGGHTPIYRLYYDVLPGVKQFRAPSVSFFLVAFALTAMAALTLERLAAVRAGLDDEGATGRRSRSRRAADAAGFGRSRWIAFGLVAIALLGAAAGPALDGAAQNAATGWLRFATFSAAIAATLWLWLDGRIRATVAAVVLSLTIVTDLWIIDRQFFEVTQPPAVMFRADGVADFLARDAASGRVWNLPPLGRLPAYHGPTNYLMRFGVDQITGEHGNQLQRWNEYLGAGETTYTDLHNVFGEFQRSATTGGVASTPLLNAAAVRYVVARADIGLPWPVAYQDPSGVVYGNPNALPRAYLVPEARVVEPGGALEAMLADGWNPAVVAFLEEAPAVEMYEGGSPAGNVQILDRQSDRVLLRAEALRPAILVLAENHYPGWQARVDGEDVPVLRVNHTLLGIAVDRGEHSVEFVFRPPALYRGLWISVGSLLVVMAAAAWGLWAARTERRAAAAPLEGAAVGA